MFVDRSLVRHIRHQHIVLHIPPFLRRTVGIVHQYIARSHIHLLLGDMFRHDQSSYTFHRQGRVGLPS